MNKKLIVALCVALILLAAAVGTVIYMEGRSAQDDTPATVPMNTTAAADATAGAAEETTEEPTEETVGISLPAEDPDDVSPEETFTQEDEVTSETEAPQDPQETEDRESNETPEDEF